MGKLSTPSIVKILPFDPAYNYTFMFFYTGNQVYKNRVVIKDEDNNSVVYDKTISSMKLEHEISANTLTAGKRYIVQVQVFDNNNNSSMLSDPILFYCFTTPMFTFSNIVQDDTCRNASINLDLLYFQPEGEKIRSYQIMQYSEDNVLINSSDIVYPTDMSSSYAYTFNNLDNNSIYYFRAIGETVNGITLDTDKIKVNVVYKTMPANLIFDVANEYCKGYITLNSNIKVVEYEFENEDNYSLENGILKLWDNSLTYKGFHAEGDFVLFIEAKKLPVKEFLRTNNNNLSLSIVNICGVYYCRLNVKDTDLSLFVSLPKARLSTDNGDLLITDNEKIIEIISTSYDDNELIVFEVKRINNLYSIKAYYKNEYLS